MKDKNLVELQIDLVNKFWEHGWVGFKADVMGRDESPDGLVIGVKGDKIMLLKIVKLPSGSSKKWVSDDAEELRGMKQIMEPPALKQGNEVTVGFAVAKGWNDRWQFVDAEVDKVKYDNDMDELNEVMRNAGKY